MRLTTTRWSLSFTAAIAWLSISVPASALNVQRLEPAETETLQAVLQILEPVIAKKKQDGTAILLTWDALYEPLGPPQP